jgi:hypothetical protein
MTRPEGLNADPQQPDAVREQEPMRPLRQFQPEIRGLIRHLINIGDLPGVIQKGELCVRLSEIVHFTAPGYDLELP